MRSRSLTCLFVLIFGLFIAGCTTPPKYADIGIDTPDESLFYHNPSPGELRGVKLLLGQLQVGMTRQAMLRALKPFRLLMITYHGSDAQNVYWLRPGVKVILHFSNRDTLLAVPDELPHGEPDDVLLDLPDSISVAAGPNVPEPEKSWQKIPITSLN
jgi:hypothetical protein